MNYNEALIKNALLNELGLIHGLKPKALTERILLSVHYRKALDEWLKVRQTVDGEKDATDEIKNEVVNAKLLEDCGIDDRRMTADAFGQVVEVVAPLDTVTSILSPRLEGGDNTPQHLPAVTWLQAFAELLVEN